MVELLPPCKMGLLREDQEYKLSSSRPGAAGLEGAEEVRIYNWRAEEKWRGSNGRDLYSSYFWVYKKTLSGCII